MIYIWAAMSHEVCECNADAAAVQTMATRCKQMISLGMQGIILGIVGREILGKFN